MSNDFSKILFDQWIDKVSDDVLLNIVFGCQEEYFGYMESEIFNNTSLDEFLHLYRSYNRNEGMNLFYKIKDKIKEYPDMKYIDVHSCKMFYSDEELIKEIRNNGINDVIYYVEEIRKYDEELIEYISESLYN